MAAFTYNEDGSLNWLDTNEMPKSETIVISEGPDRDAQFAPNNKKAQVIQLVKKKAHVDILINEFKKRLKPISQDFKEKYARQIEDVEVLQYFYDQVIAWNEMCPLLMQERITLEKERQKERSRFKKQQETFVSKKGKKVKAPKATLKKANKIETKQPKNEAAYREMAAKLMALQKDFDNSIGDMFNQLQQEQGKLKGNSIGANFKIKK